jgi:hypothetical protein
MTHHAQAHEAQAHVSTEVSAAHATHDRHAGFRNAAATQL